MSFPRLKLMDAVLRSRLAHTIASDMKNSITFWIDGACVALYQRT